MISTRRSSPSDADALRSIHLASYETAYRDLVPAELLDERLEQHRKVDWGARLCEEVAAGGDILVAEVNGRPVGLCQYGPTTDTDDDPTAVGQIHRLFVEPTWQRHGIGRQLMSRACETLAAAGRTEATLWVLAADTLRARPFYEGFGWGPDGTKRVFDRDFGTEWAGRLDDIRYRATLHGKGAD